MRHGKSFLMVVLTFTTLITAVNNPPAMQETQETWVLSILSCVSLGSHLSEPCFPRLFMKNTDLRSALSGNKAGRYMVKARVMSMPST